MPGKRVVKKMSGGHGLVTREESDEKLEERTESPVRAYRVVPKYGRTAGAKDAQLGAYWPKPEVEAEVEQLAERYLASQPEYVSPLATIDKELEAEFEQFAETHLTSQPEYISPLAEGDREIKSRFDKLEYKLQKQDEEKECALEKKTISEIHTIVFNAAGYMKGVQAGLLNYANEVRGAQLGACNETREAMYGVQLGLYNESEAMYGAQLIGWCNSSEAMYGVQLGVFNMAREARGVQLGGFNYVREADKILQIGGLCIIDSNPWYARCLPFMNYGGSKAKRDARKARKEEALKKEYDQFLRERLRMRI